MVERTVICSSQLHRKSHLGAAGWQQRRGNVGIVGYLTVAIFAITRIVAAVIYRVTRYDEIEVHGPLSRQSR